MSEAIVSVIVTTRNSAATLEKCLLSIRSQNYKHIELVVVDNFSKDDTFTIAQKYADIAIQKGPERSPQRNYAVRQSHGKYVAIIDSDMYLTPPVVEDCIAGMESSQDVAGVIIPEESIGNGFWAHCKAFERSFYVGVTFMEAARFFKKSIYQKAGGYDESMVSGEDWDLSQRIEKFGTLTRIEAFIKHDEGHISLFKTISKKYYYAKKFSHYAHKNRQTANTRRQTSIIARYALFFKKPGKLLRHPILSIGMLFMKTCEFFFGGLGLLVAKTSGIKEQA